MYNFNSCDTFSRTSQIIRCRVGQTSSLNLVLTALGSTLTSPLRMRARSPMEPMEVPGTGKRDL